MHPALATLAALLAGCTSGYTATMPSSSAHGATLSLLHPESSKQTLVLKNSGAVPLAYSHWFSLGPEPVAYCRDMQGEIRFCSLRVMLTEDDQPYTHAAYIQPGESVEFQAAASGDEQVGVQLWVDGREEPLWIDDWTPNAALERTRER